MAGLNGGGITESFKNVLGKNHNVTNDRNTFTIDNTEIYISIDKTYIENGNLEKLKVFWIDRSKKNNKEEL